MISNNHSKHTITAQQTELLIAILSENHSHVYELTELLHDERLCLEKRQREKLTDLISKKSACLNKINATEKRLEQLLNKLNRSKANKIASEEQKPELLSARMIESIIDSCPTNYRNHLYANWDQLRAAINECQSLNAINGQIINKSRSNVQAILEMMRGYSSQLDIYHANGQKREIQNKEF